MKRSFIFFFLLFTAFLFAQEERVIVLGEEEAGVESVLLSGYVFDKNDKKPLKGATVHVNAASWGIPADSTGKYQLYLAPGKYKIAAMKSGYQSQEFVIKLQGKADLNFELQKWSLTLSEVVVQADRADKGISSTKPGLTSMSIKGLRVLPTFLGEVDVLRSIQLLPGVSNVGEGSAGFNVRGGQTDQNLILYDGMQLFNPTHALGFFSAFHPAASSSFDLYKGHVPAEYGGRASAVLSVETKKPNQQKRNTEISISPFVGNIMTEAPIIKDKTSFLVAGRFSYANWLLSQVNNDDVANSEVGFWDLTGKLHHDLNENSSLSLSVYGSGDNLQFSDRYGYSWNTQLASLHWKNIIGSNWLLSTMVGTGRYTAELFEPSGIESFRISNGLSYHQAKQTARYVGLKGHKLQGGIEWTYYVGQDEEVRPFEDGGLVLPRTLSKDRGQEFAAYVQDDWDITKKFGLSAGIRYSYFTTSTNNTFQGFEPRLALRYKVNKTASLKASFDLRRQYIHQISNTTAPTPVDLWQVSAEFLPPQVAENYSVGFFQNIKNNRWETSLEFFYKNMRNLTTYKDFTNLLGNPDLPQALVSGIGEAYGFESTINLKRGRWTGWLSYTFSRSLLQVDNTDPEATINGGSWFPANFDMPHSFTLVANAKMGQAGAFSLTTTYRSGRPYTALIASYEVGNISVPHYSDRNEFRIPDYMRVDVSITFGTFINTLNDKLVFSVYNLFARNNAFSVFYTRPDRVLIPKPFKLSVIGAAFPSVSYQVSF